MKSYTDLEQSKVLAKILQIESADAYLTNSSAKGEMYCEPFKVVYGSYLRAKDSLDAYSKIVNNAIVWEVVPCWSLAALLSVLPDSTDIVKDKADTENEKYMCTVGVKYDIISTFGNNPVDACVEMIKLHEQKNFCDMNEITLDKVIEALKSMISDEDLQPYRDLGNGLYELPGNVICNKKGLNEYLNILNNNGHLREKV